MPGRGKSLKTTRGKSLKTARRGGSWPFTSDTKEECLAKCSKTPDSQGGLLDKLPFNPFASPSSTPSSTPPPAQPQGFLEKAAEVAGFENKDVKPAATAAGGGRRSKRRRYRRIKSRIRKRR